MGKWIANGGPSTCAACNQLFPHRDNRVQAQIGKDGKLYCYDTTCEQDALEAQAYRRRRAS
jgi:hypothetical protein